MLIFVFNRAGLSTAHFLSLQFLSDLTKNSVTKNEPISLQDLEQPAFLGLRFLSLYSQQ